MGYRIETVLENGQEYEVRVYENGVKMWFQCGIHQRTDGPATRYTDGTESWWWKNVPHRVDGPSLSMCNGVKAFCFHGVNITAEIYELGYQDAEPEFLRAMIPLIAAGKRT